MGLDNIVIPPFVDIFLIILMVEVIAGIFTNVFIMSVNIQAWASGQSLNSADHIVVSLALSNIGFSCMNAATIICVVFFCQTLFIDYVFDIIYYTLTYTLYSSSWLNALLCLFFYLKILTFKKGFLAWLKMRTSTMVPWLIFLSQGISFVSCLPLVWSITKVYDNATVALQANQTERITGYQISYLYNVFALTINCFVPFLVVMVTTAHIIASLCSHTRHMQQNMGESGTNLKAHQGAARTMTSLLILYLIFYIVEVALGFLSMISPLYWVCFVIIVSFSTIESILLIMGNSKLKLACSKMLKHCKNKG
ncbi:taste receptor type 2 member 40-like [Pelodytes ibericus]